MTVAANAAQSLDYVNLATNLGIFLSFVVAAVLGLKKGLKLFEKQENELPEGPSKVIAASFVESATISLWTESNRSAVESHDRLAEAVADLAEVIVKNTEAVYSARNKISEEVTSLSHQIELLRVQNSRITP